MGAFRSDQTGVGCFAFHQAQTVVGSHMVSLTVESADDRKRGILMLYDFDAWF
jgi:hypothetical protein